MKPRCAPRAGADITHGFRTSAGQCNCRSLALRADVLGKALDRQRNIESLLRDRLGLDVVENRHRVDDHELTVLPPQKELRPWHVRLAVRRAELDPGIRQLHPDRLLYALILPIVPASAPWRSNEQRESD